MQIGIHCFEIRSVETITDLVQFVKPYKTRRKVISVSHVCMVSPDLVFTRFYGFTSNTSSVNTSLDFAPGFVWLHALH